jgi:hypothetical protein
LLLVGLYAENSGTVYFDVVSLPVAKTCGATPEGDGPLDFIPADFNVENAPDDVIADLIE